MTDKSISLGDLAARRGTAPQTTARKQSSNCRNPECQSGMTPGAVASGGGKNGAPLYGPGGVGASRLMRWGWVQCLACNPSAKAPYRALNLSEGEMARRAEWANSKAPYVIEERRPVPRPQGTLGLPNATHVDSGKLTELMEQNKKLGERLDEVLKQNAQMTEAMSRMTMQLAALLEDNAKLRKVTEHNTEVK